MLQYEGKLKYNFSKLNVHKHTLSRLPPTWCAWLSGCFDSRFSSNSFTTQTKLQIPIDKQVDFARVTRRLEDNFALLKMAPTLAYWDIRGVSK